MARFLNIQILLIGITLVHPEFVSAADVYDCYKLQADLVESHGPAVFIYHWFPRCLTGGYYENVQCNDNGCYCAYVDTGIKIPQTVENVLMEYLRQSCPWLPEKEPDACAIPPVDYPCKTKSRKFFYNPDTGDCVKTTRGCLGFDTSQACKEACVVQKRDRCNFRMEKGKPCDRKKPGEKWYHDDNEGTCRPFLHEGCGGNSNNYREKWICLKTCEGDKNMDLIIQVGYTKYIISLPTWLVTQNHFVPSAPNKLTIEEFKDIETYMVEISRFPVKEGETPDEEEKRKLKSEKYRPKHAPKYMSRKEVCNQDKSPGPCRGFFSRWYFHKKQSKCVKFIYGGCSGNENRHRTATGCAAFCNAEVSPTELERIGDLISSGGEIGGPLEQGKSKSDGNEARRLEIATPAPMGDPVVAGEAEIDFVFGDDEESSDPVDPTETTAPETTTSE